MRRAFAAVIKQDEGWWIGWVEEVPGVNSQGKTKAELIWNLRSALKEALKLPPWERAQIIDTLWQSLDPAEQAAIDQAWLVECHDRLGAYRSGKLQALPGEETLHQIEDSLGQ